MMKMKKQKQKKQRRELERTNISFPRIVKESERWGERDRGNKCVAPTNPESITPGNHFYLS